MIRNPRTVAHSLVCVFLVTLVGCASWLMKGEPPEVLVTNVTPLEGTALEQRLQVDLRIRNPNDFDLLATGIDYILNLNGKPPARGSGNTAITVPRLSDTVVSVQTSTSTSDVALRCTLSLALYIRDAAGMKSAWAHAFLNRSSASAA